MHEWTMKTMMSKSNMWNSLLWWEKPEHPMKTTNLPQNTDTTQRYEITKCSVFVNIKYCMWHLAAAGYITHCTVYSL
jgi:hypothetical protein